MQGKQTRLIDVAEATGFSANTVSLALSGSSRISEKTREMIQKAAAELNYVPNNLARSLVRQDSRTIGVILRGLGNPILVKTARRIETYLAEKGYIMILMNSKSDGMKEINTLISQQVGGILVYPDFNLPSVVQNFLELRKRKFPVVLLSSNGKTDALDTVYVNRFSGGYMATAHLATLGHRGIVCLGSDEQKRQGYLAAMEEYGCLIREELLVGQASNGYEGGYLAAKELFSRHIRDLTAVSANTDVSAIGMLKYFHEAGIRVPEDIALVGYDNIDISEYVDPPLTTVSYSVEQETVAAIDLLLKRMTEDVSITEGVNISIEPELLIRSSCGAVLKPHGLFGC